MNVEERIRSFCQQVEAGILKDDDFKFDDMICPQSSWASSLTKSHYSDALSRLLALASTILGLLSGID
jgi:hypothetical protein